MGLFCLDTDKQCENDAAVQVLSNIFGSQFIDGFIKTGNPASALPNPTDLAPIILGGLGMVATMLAVVVFLSLSFLAVLNSAQDGEAFGKGSAKSIIIVRFVFSIILLTPTNSGYCIAQIILMMFVLWSNGETNKIYSNVVSASAMSKLGVTPTSLTLSENQDVYGVRGFALGHFSQAYCYNLVNANYYPESFKPAHSTTHSLNPDGNISSIYLDQGTRNINAHVLKDVSIEGAMGKLTNIGLVDAGTKLSKDPTRAVCGGLKVFTPEGTGYEATAKMLSSPEKALGMSTDEQKNLFKAIADVSTKIAENKKIILLQTTADVSEWMNTANIPYDFSNGATNYADQLRAVDFTGLEKVINNSVKKGNTEFMMIARDNNINTLITNLTVALTAKGWTYAGGIKQRIITAQSSVGGSLNYPIVTLTSTQVQLLELNDDREAKFKETLAAVDILIRQFLGESSFSSNYDLNSVDALLPDNLDESASADEINDNIQEGYASFLANFRRNLTNLILTGEFRKGTPESLVSNNLEADWLNSDRDVLTNIQRTGEFLSVMNARLNISIKGVEGAAVALTGVTGFTDTSYRVAYAVFLAINQIIVPVISKILTYMSILALYMAVILPSMPYFFFITGVVAWYIHILQAMAGMPFWAIMHMIPERSFVGSQTQGYVTVVGLFLRPMLTLTGLFFGFILANPILLFVTDTFFSMQENLMTSNSNMVGAGLYQLVTELVTFFQWLIVYCTLMLQICYMIFGLAGTLPDSVLRWLGSGLSAGGWGESNAQTALQGGAKFGLESGGKPQSGGGNKGTGNPANPNNNGGGGNGGGGGGNGGGGGIPVGNHTPSNPNAPAVSTAQGVADRGSSQPSNTPGNTPPSAFQPSGAHLGNAGSEGYGGQINTASADDSGMNTMPDKANLSSDGKNFIASGGVVGADGKPLGNSDLWKANVNRLPESQVGFARSMAIGYSVGGVVGAAKGVSSGLSSAKSTLNNGGSAQDAAKSFMQSMGGSIKNTASSTANFVGNKHFASHGGVAINNGDTTSYTKASNAHQSTIYGAYSALNKANK